MKQPSRAENLASPALAGVRVSGLAMLSQAPPVSRLRLLGLLVALGIAACSDATAPAVPIPAAVIPATDSLSLSSLGETRQLATRVLDQSGSPMSDASLSWASSNQLVVTVSDAGIVTAVGNGIATVTVRSGSATGRVTLVVAQVAASLELSFGQLDFAALGDTLRLAATVRDAGGSPITDAAVGWVSVDTLVATVSSDGLLTAVANGNTSVIAQSGAALSTTSVRVMQLAETVTLSTDSLVFSSLGDTATVSATVTDASGSGVGGAVVGWASSDPSVVTVSDGGVVTAAGNGTAVVTAAADLGVDTVHVMVQQVPASVLLQPDSVVLGDLGESAQLTATVLDGLGSPLVATTLTWMSSDDLIATVDGSGLVAAVATGTVTISVDAGGPTAQVTARVEPELTLVPAGPTGLAGEVTSSLSLSVRAEDVFGSAYEGATVTWAVDPGSGSIASQSTTLSDATGHSGAVWLLGTVAGPQRATASLTSRGNLIEVAFSATASAGPATSATLVADSILLSARGETAFLAPTYIDTFGNATSGAGMTWLSRDPLVATVAMDGLVTGQGAGSTYAVGSLGSPVDSILVTVVMRGAITITFDDGFREAYDNAWPVFQQFGLPGNIAVNPGQVGFPAYMTKAELDEVHAAGFSIVSHTMTHDSLTILSLGDLDYQLRASQEWIEAQGYEGGNVLVVPYHVWGNRERDAIAGYYEAARGTSSNSVVPDSLAAWKPSNPYDLTGIEADDLPYTTQQGRDVLRALLQRTAGEGTFLDVFFHHLPAGNVADFQATLAVIDEFRDRVLPYRMLYPRFARGVF